MYRIHVAIVSSPVAIGKRKMGNVGGVCTLLDLNTVLLQKYVCCISERNTGNISGV